MRYLLTVALLVSSACATFKTVPAAPSHLDAPPIYAEWYHQLEQCSGLKGDYKALDFYAAGSSFHNGHHFNGYWELGSIVIMPAKLNDRATVMHEMMHDLTKSTAHRRQNFRGVCGDISTGETLSD